MTIVAPWEPLRSIRSKIHFLKSFLKYVYTQQGLESPEWLSHTFSKWARKEKEDYTKQREDSKFYNE